MYRDDLTALAARHAALETELAQKTRELDEAGRMLEESRAQTRLPVLANIRVASPCPAQWDAMVGDDRVRHCGECKKNVYNLSELTRAEAEALIVEKEGKLCINYYQRKDGTILLKDCSVGVARGRRRRAIAVGAVALLAGGGALGAHLADRGAEPLRPGDMSFDDHVAPRTEYRIVQDDDQLPDELVVKIIDQAPAHDDGSYRLGGAVALTEDELKALTPAK